MAARIPPPMPVPQRLDGRHVVAAVRMPTTPGRRADRYAAVTVDDNSGQHLFHPAAYVGDDRLYHGGPTRHADDLGHALLQLFAAAAPIWEPVAA